MQSKQVGPKMGHDSAKMTVLGSVWQLLGGSWEIFGYSSSDLWKNGQSVKTNSTLSLLVAFWGLDLEGGSWRLSWEGFGSYFGRCWLKDGVSSAILGDVWTSWRQGWRSRAQDAAAQRKSWIFGGLEGGRG